MTNKYGLGTGIAAGIVVTILVAIAVWLIVVNTGAYNVAATDRHADLARWTLDTTMHRSVSSRAESLDMPETFTPELIAAGGRAMRRCARTAMPDPASSAPAGPAGCARCRLI